MDGRRNNGGNSTKTTGPDKRKNEYKKALEQAAGVEEVVEVLQMLHKKSIEKQDVKAAQLFLAYYLGRPEQSVNINPDNDFHIPLIQFLGVKDKS